jgi:hypothetical protein
MVTPAVNDHQRGLTLFIAQLDRVGQALGRSNDAIANSRRQVSRSRDVVALTQQRIARAQELVEVLENS